MRISPVVDVEITKRLYTAFFACSCAFFLHDLQAQTELLAIDFGDDLSTWANDQECDDPRFTGEGMASTLVESDRLHDASDCRSLFMIGVNHSHRAKRSKPGCRRGFWRQRQHLVLRWTVR